MTKKPLRIGGIEIGRGVTETINIPVARLYTHTEATLPVQVVSGKRSGPRLFVCAAVHGDEIVGVEIIRRLLRSKALRRLRGVLIAIPVVNVYGLLHHSRYLPDRRDLNRHFPGGMEGSLTSRLANLFMTEVVRHCTHGIDLHTGSNHRSNLPQLRVDFEESNVLDLALAFGAPVVLDSKPRPGSLRKAVSELGVPLLVYEAGEALRFSESAVRTGLRGILSVMRSIGMLPPARGKCPTCFQARSSTWVRAPISGILNTKTRLGSVVTKRSVLGAIADPFGENEVEVLSTGAGVVIGCLKLPLVHKGDALFHVASLDRSARKAFSEEDLGDFLDQDFQL